MTINKMVLFWVIVFSVDVVFSQTSDTTGDNMVRFKGDGGYLHYDLSKLGQIHHAMILEAQIENFSFNFITSQRNGLIWMDDRKTEQLYIGIINGDLVFVFDDHVRPTSISRLRSSSSITDYVWHSFEVKRNNRNLKFFIDSLFITELDMYKDIQFVTSSHLYLGGAPNMTLLTGGRMSSSFNGALYLVEYVKTVSQKVIRISLFNNINSGSDKHGDITIQKYGQNVTDTNPTIPTTAEYIIDVIALRSASVHIPGWLDLRRGGSFGFRFRTFDFDAIIFFSERMMNQPFALFISLELVDGKLYFVYNLGNIVKRAQVPGSHVANGNWHDVNLVFGKNSIVVHLDEDSKIVQLTTAEQNQLMFNRGLYIAGLPPKRNFPGYLWSQRGYRGCFSKLRIDDNITSILGPVTVNDQTGLSTTCQLTPHCNPDSCLHGICREGMDRYVCNCDGTGYGGMRCDTVAPIGQFRGDTYVTYSFSSSFVSGTLDVSLRFNTMLANTFLFQTEANKRTEYIRAEIKNGRLKISVFVGGKIKEFFAGSRLNDFSWHTMYIRRRGRKLELWVDNQQHVTGYLDKDYPSFTIDKVHFTNHRKSASMSDFIPYSGYLQSVNIGGVHVLDILRRRADVTIDWITNMKSSNTLHFPVFNPITVLSQDAYVKIPIFTSRQGLHVMFKLRTNKNTGVVLVLQDHTGMFLYIEVIVGHVLVGLLGTSRNYSKRIARRVDDSRWHDIEIIEGETEIGQSQYLVRIDNVRTNISTFNTPAFNVTQMYVGDVPVNMLKEIGDIGRYMHSKIGFVGCLSSVYINGQTPELERFARNPSILTGTCNPNHQIPTPDTVIQHTLQFPDKGGYVSYRLSNLAKQYPDIVQQSTRNETFDIRFRTRQQDGLIWMERRDGQTIYLALKGGYLVFGIDSGIGSPQVLNLGSQRNLADGAWHDFKLMKIGRHLKFFIDNQPPKETYYQNMIQLASEGNVYVGGSPDTFSYTRGQVATNFEGQLSGVEYKKGASDTLMNLISNIKTQGNVHGRVTVSNNLDVPLPTNFPISPSQPDQTVTLLDHATFRSSAWKIGNYIDLTSDGIVEFSFRTFDRRGLIWFAKRPNSDVFLGIELFDGKVYLIFNFGQSDIRRRQISTGTVTNGQINAVRLAIQNDVLTASVGSNIVKENLNPLTKNQRNFNGGQFISGLPSYPPYIWSGEGFNGCLINLVITATATELSGLTSLPSNNTSISAGCVSRDPCGRNPCNRGTCYSSLDEFECDCTATGYTGRTCSEIAVVGGFTGNNGAIYRKTVSQKSYTNDLAVRFKTMFPRAILFKTYSNSSDDYIKGELVDGSIKITVYKDGITDTHSTGSHLNDNTWHSLYVQRRDERLEIWVDQRPHVSGTLRGEDLYIDISGIIFGSGSGSRTEINIDDQLPPFIGYMQNVYFDDIDIIGKLHSVPNVGVTWYNTTPTDAYDPLIYDSMTLSSKATYLELGTLPVSTALHIKLKFRTGQDNGLLLFNEGRNGEFIALELVHGIAVFACNTGGNDTVIGLKSSVNDNKWHSVEIMETARNNQRFYQARVDKIVHSIPILAEMEPTRPLFLGGLPRNMFVTNSIVKKTLRSDSGYIGCVASIYLNNGKPNIARYTMDNNVVLRSCKDITGYCPPVDPCQHGGTCSIGVTRYHCDCEETGYSGPHCGLHPIGIYLGKHEQPGVITYTLKQSLTSQQDSLVFGFMTKRADGTLVRLENLSGTEYIVIRLAGGSLVADFNTGTGVKTLTLANKRFNDGKYHVVHFYRDELGARLKVDGAINTIDGSQSSFDQLKYVFLGGRPSSDGGIKDAFYGFLGGFYYNRRGLIDQYLATNDTAGFTVTGDTSFVQDHHYELVSPGYYGYIHISPEIGGGGVVGKAARGSKEINIGNGVHSGTDGGGALLPESLLPVVAHYQRGEPLSVPIGVSKPGPRAGALIGSILGTLAFAASMLWAVWLCKPGVLPCCGKGGYFDLAKIGFDMGNAAGGGSGVGTGASGIISSAKVTSDAISGGVSTGGTSQVQVSSLSMAKSISGCDETDAYASSGDGAKVTIVNSGANLNGGGSSCAYYSTTGNSDSSASGGQSSYSSTVNQSLGKSSVKSSKVFYSSTSGVTLVNDGFKEASNFNEESTWDTSTMRSTTCLIDSGTMKSSTSLVDAAGSSSYSHSASATNITSTSTGDSGGTFVLNSAEGHGDSANADYDFPMGYNETCSNYTSSKTLIQEGFNSSYTFQGGTGGKNGQLSYSPLTVTPGAAGEEVRVDCCFVTGDGSSVVTGSTSGPPQVWNMQTGELLKIMKGDTMGSSNLHLACYDSLLVGTVQADLDVNAFSIGKGVTHKKLQVWNFVTGRPLEMGPSDTCSAICLTDDKESVVFAKSDKFGNGTNITIWDLMGNQIQKQFRHDAPVGNNDYINFLSLSSQDKYCVAGFTNSFDNQIEFLTFDTSTATGLIKNPNILKLDAFSDCTVLLPRDEAVTGLRDGSLRVWSLRTGQKRRNLLDGSESHGHANAVTALALSQDQKFLVSASADKTLKVWDMDREQLSRTLTGHLDEVWCTAISQDGEIVVSGSRDGSIRLWRLEDETEICAFPTGIDVFYVTMSHDRGTVVALGDKYSARKLIMLQVVHTKIRKEIVP
ncbi:uncharacterized protein LOC132559438 [Ylistrum balloti]|uniref:uncharacterized protein LOC132559438 n=1 Tax=Ylistrum balloti TaxID=509963 RepID=UPI002905A0BC|nr:uncharacterized protein LOC132559438 [Ylistrum balloti]